jgi:acyl dehydratase
LNEAKSKKGPSPEETVANIKARAKPWPRGNKYEDFTVGRVFKHHWGRTINEADNTLFTTLTLHFNPLYTNRAYARAHGHDDLVVCPLLVFNTVFGLSVEDLSEGGGPFLGVDGLTYHRPVLVGETLSAESEVVSARETASRPEFGIVTWHTRGYGEDGGMVIDYQRTNLVRKRS